MYISLVNLILSGKLILAQFIPRLKSWAFLRRFRNGATCSHNPNYMLSAKDNYRFKPGAKIVVILNQAATFYSGMSGITYYCLDCVDQVFLYLKSKLDKKLWIFQ